MSLRIASSHSQPKSSSIVRRYGARVASTMTASHDSHNFSSQERGHVSRKSADKKLVEVNLIAKPHPRPQNHRQRSHHTHQNKLDGMMEATWERDSALGIRVRLDESHMLNRRCIYAAILVAISCEGKKTSSPKPHPRSDFDRRHSHHATKKKKITPGSGECLKK